MSNKQFKSMINGYDRYQVDDVVSKLEDEITLLIKERDYYKNEAKRSNDKLNVIINEYKVILEDQSVKDKMASEISRMALNEANSIIQSASKNADQIIQEALSSAKVILTELAYTAKMTKDSKDQMKDKINDILKKIDEFESIELPSLTWLENYEK